MAKEKRDPAFLFYDGDAARDVSHMDRLERGAYFDLIQAQKKFHGYTMEQSRKLLGKDFETVWNALEIVLEQENGTYFIPWLRNSLEERAQKNEIQRKRIQDYWDRVKNHGNTTEEPSENEDESNIDTNTVKHGERGKKFGVNFKAQPEELLLRRLAEGAAKVKQYREENSESAT